MNMTTKKTQEADSPLRDRISELPVEILHHILGFLEMDELLIRTSLVSTKWRNLWKSVSKLNFPRCRLFRVDNGGAIRRNNVEKYEKFVDHVLRLRDSQASKIQIFKYQVHNLGGDSNDYIERIHNFIITAVVNQGAQEIRILGVYSRPRPNNNNNMIIHFNPSIFTSAELEKFTFVVIDRGFLIQFPRSMCSCATQLTSLRLCGIRLPEGDDAAQLHLVCPLLETFHMISCYTEHLKVLHISAPKLNSLSINNFSNTLGDFDPLGGCRIEICTPNLTKLYYSGRVYVDCFTENLPRLANASLDFSMETGLVKKTTSFASKLLKGLTSADSLTLAGFEVFPEVVLNDLLKPFASLTTLSLATSCRISSIHGMAHILNICNSIEKFVWDVTEICTVEGERQGAKSKRRSAHLLLPQCRLSYLKLIRIERMHGHKNEIEFVKFLLKNSVVLEDIKIETARNSPKRSIEENLKQFIEEEPSVRRSIKLHIL